MVWSDSVASVETVTGLAEASIRRGQEITIFFNAEGVKLLLDARRDEKLVSLASRKIKLLACRTSARECGIDSQGQLLKGATMSSLSELVELMERSDRVVSVG